MKDLIKEKIAKYLKGQGTQIDVSGKLPEILENIVDMVAPIFVQATDHVEVQGYKIPRLTLAQLQEAYNGVVAGKSVNIISDTNVCHFRALQADSLGGEICVNFSFYNFALVEYVASGDAVEIKVKVLDGEEVETR